jgi:2-dehydro-3-deoxyphosphogluconate aldolase/(4S)-4-hydroxy-2-oxoglutarate aldolase
MKMEIEQRIRAAGVIPVIALEHARDAVPLCAALAAGGLCVAEITFRTAAAPEAMALVRREFPDFLLGAGTVTLAGELDRAVATGAGFAVAPGLNPRIVQRAQQAGLPFFPGVCTPTEIEAALELGCTLLKFFPAGAMGGLKILGDLYAPYKHRGVRFIPTGGISATNLGDYLSHPGVLACGGSWLATGAMIKGQAWEQITRLAREAVELNCALRPTPGD